MALTKVTGGTISTTGNYHTNNINSAGVITATKFVGPFEGDVSGIATGADKIKTVDESADTTCFPVFVNTSTNVYQPAKIGSNLTFNSSTGDLGATYVTAEKFVGNISGTGATFTTLDVSGTLNYTHVTDVYSVGVATFANNVQAGAGISVVGVSTFTNGVGIADSIFHTGDNNTAIKFDTDTIKFETAGLERLSIASNGDVTLTNTSSNPQLALKSAAHGISEIQFGDANDAVRGNIIYRAGNEGDALCFNGYNNSEAMRINSSGYVGIGNTATGFFSVATRLVVGDGGGSEGMTIYSDSTNDGYIVFADGTSDPSYRMGQIIYSHNTDTMQFRTGGNTERLRIRNDGNVVAANDLAVTGVTTSNDYDLSAISSTISDTANDVFVYDTRKDSDGGAWRHRTQHTSWYNETLGTAQRGTRKEFPVVAVLVTYNNGLRIYDGDDPNLPMWMEAWQYENDSSGNTQWWGGSGTANKVVAMNGMIVMGVTLGTRNLHFINDRMSLSYSPASGDYTQAGGVANRNDAYGSWGKSDQYYTPLRNHTTNDVAITVVPNAPIDVSTGLPNPTFAVATDSGVTVRKSDFSAVDIYRSNDDDVHYVTLDGDRVIMFMELGGVYVAKIPDSDQSGNPNSLWSVYGTFSANTSGVNYPKVLGLGAGNGIAFMKDHTFAISGYNATLDTYKGLSILAEDIVSSGKGMSAWIGTRYNTGWMYGDNKGAYLSDTTVETMSEGGYTNLLTNGSDWTGASGTTAPNGWTSFGLAESAFTIDSGRLKIGNGASNNMTAMHQNVTTVVGKTYTLYFNYQLHSSAQYLIFRVGTATLNGSIGYLYGTSTSDIQSTLTFVATQTSTNISVQLQASSGNAYAWIDTMYVKAVGAADRSIKTGNTGYVGANGANGFALFGSLDKTAVATGAELVAYGPFSNSNRLRQPYNSALNFETNDFSVMFWMNNSGTDVHQTLVGRDNREFSVDILDNSSYNRRFRIYAWNSADSLQTFDSNDDPFPLNTWVHVCVNYTSGNTATIYVNGVLNKTGTLNYDIDASSFTTTTHGLNIGARDTDGSYNYAATGTKLALVRISAGAPSADKVKKIYNDERKLFSPNAKCTLYGTSEAVTAIAYDDSNNVLHAGTSAGRSEFIGLNRINNTTTAVTTAISASNGLVAEQ